MNDRSVVESGGFFDGIPTGDTPHPGKMLDIIMLVIPGGAVGVATAGPL